MNLARYTVHHETRYAYTAPVSQSWQLARLTPRMLPWQHVVAHSLTIEPKPDERRDEFDCFGNMVTHFGLHGAHRVLTVSMECMVEVSERPAVLVAGAALPGALQAPTQTQFQMQMQVEPPAAWGMQSQMQGGAGLQQQWQQSEPASASPASQALHTSHTSQTSQASQGQALAATSAPPLVGWETVREAVRRHPQLDGLAPARMSEPTPLVPLSEGARVYALASFARGRPWFDAVFDLMRRIHADFEFQPGATTVSTSVDEVLWQRSGVCQDFAHLMLACLRGLGLPARYVSGYLLTDPPPGMPRLMGVDASHAWVAAYSPQHGWVEFDPTNNQLADTRYITLAWGADFADVVPLRGVILGGGEQRMSVSVSVMPG